MPRSCSRAERSEQVKALPQLQARTWRTLTTWKVKSSPLTTRKLYAESIRQKTNLRSERLVRALAEVPREDYLGPGPWKIMRFVFPLKYEDTPDASSPRSLRSLDREFLLLTKESDRLARSPNGVHLTCAAADPFFDRSRPFMI